jgi:hypothetical protein
LRTWKVEKIFSSFVLMKLPHRISSLLLTVTLVVARLLVSPCLTNSPWRRRTRILMRRSSVGIDGGFVRAAHKEGWL